MPPPPLGPTLKRKKKMRKNEGGKRKKREKPIGCREGLRESELQLPAPPAPAHAQRRKEGAAAPCVRTRADWRDALSVRATPRPAAAVPARGSARGARRSERGGAPAPGPAPDRHRDRERHRRQRERLPRDHRPRPPPPGTEPSPAGPTMMKFRFRRQGAEPHRERLRHDLFAFSKVRAGRGAGPLGGGGGRRRYRRPPPSCAGCGTPGGAAPCGTAGGAAPGRWGAGVCVWGSHIAALPPPPLIPRPPRAAAPRYRSTQRGYTEGLGTPAPTTSPSVTLRDRGVLCGRLIALQRSDTPGTGGCFAPP